MSDSHTPSRYLRRIMEEQGDHPEDHDFVPSSAERQHAALAFSLHTEHLDGRCSEGFAWSHYGGYRWEDESEQEKLILIFGSRALEITGLNLRSLLPHIREGQLNSIRELPKSQREQLVRENPENNAIIAGIKAYPDFEEMLKEIKGEQDEHPVRHAKRA